MKVLPRLKESHGGFKRTNQKPRKGEQRPEVNIAWASEDSAASVPEYLGEDELPG